MKKFFLIDEDLSPLLVEKLKHNVLKSKKICYALVISTLNKYRIRIK